MNRIETRQNPSKTKNQFGSRSKRSIGSVSSSESKDEVESALLLNIVVRESASVLKLLAGENQTLLVRRDALLVLNPTHAQRTLVYSVWSLQRRWEEIERRTSNVVERR
jgi:hypothetical protein